MDPDDFQSTIRAYSTEVDHRLPPDNEAHDLGQALIQQVNSETPVPSKHSLIHSFFEKDESDNCRDPLTELIHDESVQLAKKLLDFDKTVSKKDRMDDSQFEPTIQGVIKVTQQVFERWEKNKREGFMGTTKALFHRFCDGINSHSSMLKVLPEGSEYVSLFTGVLSVVINASANHEKVVEGFVQNLCSIGESVKDIQVDEILYNTDAMIEAVSRFYSNIFLYLESVMDWIMKKRRTRLIASFNENLMDRFENDIKRIRSSADAIRNLAQQSSRAEVRYHRQETEGAYRDIRLGLRGVERQNAEIMHRLEAINHRQAQIEEYRQHESQYQRQLGQDVKLFLEERARHERMIHYSLETVSSGHFQVLAQSGLPLEKLNQGLSSLRPPHGPHLTERQLTIVDLVTELTSSDEIALNSRHLEDFFSRDRIRLEADDSAPMPFDPDVISRITDWSKGQDAPMLRIDGPVVDCEEERNPLTMLATQLIDLTAKGRLHVISYFCELSRPVKAAEREMRATVALVYSLVRQLIELLPPEFEASVDFSEARFRQLDGSIESCDEAIRVFQDLLDVVPAATVYCIIDGLQLMDDRRVEGPLRAFLQGLRGGNGKLRVLFTTSGRSACLSKELEVEETLVIDAFRKGVATHGLSI